MAQAYRLPASKEYTLEVRVLDDDSRVVAETRVKTFPSDSSSIISLDWEEVHDRSRISLNVKAENVMVF